MKKNKENQITKVEKRDGRIVDFEEEKIRQAIFKALTATGQGDGRKSKRLSDRVVQILNRRFKKGEIPHVEQIQDIVEEVLILEGLAKTAKAYILYREQRRRIREAVAVSEEAVDKVDQYLERLDWEVQENANMAFSLQGLNHYVVSYVMKKYWLNKVYPPEIRQADEDGDFHIHNLDTLGPYCVGWDLYDLLLRGFGGVSGKVESRPAKHFRVALGQAVNFLYTLQGEASGAVSFSNFDTLLAPFIRYDNLNYQQVKQALQEFMFNMAIPTRVGFQTPFTNVTLDINPSPVFARQPVIIGGKPQDKTYGEFQEEMDIFNKAFYEVLIEGDSKGRPFTFPIPTINITKDFNWDNPVLEPLWEATAKYGINYFANYIHSDMRPEDIRSMCCRLRLNLTELYNRGGGGLFGSGSLTGSIGVVTINMPRIGYLSKTKKEFFERLARVMDLAKESLEIKRKTVENFTQKGLHPYSRHYLESIYKMRGKYWANHFSTIGLVGMNEALLNFIGENIASRRGRRFTLEVLKFMRERLVKYQEETGNIYNLEQTPAESTAYRLALKDKEKYPKIITAGTKRTPYYTNCVSEDTEILTDKGWRKIDEIEMGEKALTYNVKGKFLEYKPLIAIYKYPKEKRKMIRIKHKYIDLLVTPNHFILYSPQGAPGKEVFTFANNLNEYFNIRVGAEYKKDDNEKFSDDFLKLLGWIVSEGHFENDNAGIRISQSSNSKYVLEIRETLNKLGINFREWKDNVFTWGKNRKETTFRIPAEIGKKIHHVVDKKEIPREILNEISPRQAEVLIETIVKGDGTKYKTYSVINTANQNLADQLQELAIKAGHYVAIHDYRNLTGTFHIVISNKKRSLNKHQISKKEHVKEVEYEGRVWCVETENKTIVIRRKVGNNYKYCITGNSTQLPVGYTNDIFEALKLQDEIQCQYTGGSVLHLFLGEKVADTQTVKKLVRRVFENFRLPYITITPTFSICPTHGYLAGEHFFCPQCTIKQPCEVYSRIVGYLRPVAQWNFGKQQEFKERKEFKLPKI